MTATLKEVMYEAGQTIEHIDFPVSAVLSMITNVDGDATVEVATIGREGMAGLPRIPRSRAKPEHVPGHLVATFESTGATLMTVLLIIVVAAACVYLWRNPARDMRTAVLQMVVLWTLIFGLAPAARYGYFIYPLLLVALRNHLESAPALAEPRVRRR